MFLPTRFLVALVIALEVVATVVVADALGVVRTLVWWVVAFVVGVLVVRMAGAQAWAGLRGTSERGVAPGDTALLFLAGVLILVPGVLSDVAGAFLLLPPGRTLVRRTVARRVGRRFSGVHGTVLRIRRHQQPGDVQAGELVDDGPDTGPARRPDDPDALPPR